MSSVARWLGSLHARLILVQVVLLSSVGVVVVFLLLRAANRFFEEVHARLDAEVAAHIAETIPARPDGTFDPGELKALFTNVMVINPALEVYLVDGAGNLLAYDAPEELIARRRIDLAPVRRSLELGSGALEYGDDPRSARGNKPFSAHPLEISGRPVGFVYVILGGQGYDSVLAPLRQSFALRSVALLAAGMVLVASTIGVLAVGRLTRPLRALRARMGAFAGVGSGAAQLAGGDEVEELVRAFESMARRIRAQVAELRATDERRREFVAGISHDLRTPASGLESYLEALVVRDGHMSRAERAEDLQTALRQARRLGRLIDQLSELARLEARETEPRHELFSLAELVQDTAREFDAAAASSGVSLRAVFPYDLPEVRADIGLIQRALDNLISNAVRHAGRGGEVVVRAGRTTAGVEVSVWNSGAPIPAKELSRLLGRPSRGPGAAQSRGGGARLGLAITRRIVQLHGAGMRVSSSRGGGTSFSFVLRVPARSREAPAHGQSRA